MHLLYPGHPFSPGQPDEQFAAEVEAVRAAGFTVSVFSLEKFQTGEFSLRPLIPFGAEVLYRGWMLSRSEYERLVSELARSGFRALIPTEEYLSNHYLPNWYPAIQDLTPETRIFPPDSDLENELRSLNWPEYFMKDYVKSLKTSIGSRISRPEQVSAVIAEMKRFRGVIEGGFCVRRVEQFVPDSERRYFVVNGTAFAAKGEVPGILHECAERHKSRFYSVDVVRRGDGRLRIVEIGDGQVSDLVGWTPKQFAAMLRSQFST
jgi:hypothetical protein